MQNVIKAKDIAEKIAYFANKEGLDAHAKSVTVRFEND